MGPQPHPNPAPVITSTSLSLFRSKTTFLIRMKTFLATIKGRTGHNGQCDVEVQHCQQMLYCGFSAENQGGSDLYWNKDENNQVGLSVRVSFFQDISPLSSTPFQDISPLPPTPFSKGRSKQTKRQHKEMAQNVQRTLTSLTGWRELLNRITVQHEI